jgi:hypothetical protein
MARDPDNAWNDWHWKKKGRETPRRIRVPTPHIGEDTRLIEAGSFVSTHFEPLDATKRRLERILPIMRADEMTEEAALEGNEPEQYSVIELEEPDWPSNWVSFDFDHPDDRIYILLSSAIRAEVAANLWDPEAPSFSLGEVAAAVGGSHGDDDDYPDIQVQPLGHIFYLSYYTHKEEEGDGGQSNIWIHRMGEEGGIEPILAVSEDGRLWIAGGSYKCPNAGIMQ